jgi:hypothetical protein
MAPIGTFTWPLTLAERQSEVRLGAAHPLSAHASKPTGRACTSG